MGDQLTPGELVVSLLGTPPGLGATRAWVELSSSGSWLKTDLSGRPALALTVQHPQVVPLGTPPSILAVAGRSIAELTGIRFSADGQVVRGQTHRQHWIIGIPTSLLAYAGRFDLSTRDLNQDSIESSAIPGWPALVAHSVPI